MRLLCTLPFIYGIAWGCHLYSGWCCRCTGLGWKWPCFDLEEDLKVHFEEGLLGICFRFDSVGSEQIRRGYFFDEAYFYFLDEG